MKKNLLYLLLACLGYFIVPSCSAPSFGKIPAVVDSSDKRICAIPFAIDVPTQKNPYFDSKTGQRIAQNIEELIRYNGDNVTLFDAASLEHDVTSYRFTQPDWGNICQQHDLDFIITATIKKFKWHDPKNPTFFRGEAAVDLKVVSKENEVLFAGTVDRIFYPKRRSDDNHFEVPGALRFEVSAEDIRKGLENMIALEIAPLFYKHEEEEH